MQKPVGNEKSQRFIQMDILVQAEPRLRLSLKSRANQKKHVLKDADGAGKEAGAKFEPHAGNLR
jgi:hypothetical protein